LILILEKYKDVLTINDICEILKIGKNTAYGLLKSGEIPNRKLAGKYIIPKIGIIRFIESLAA
jgi:excisionase family DNA binding protein